MTTPLDNLRRWCSSTVLYAERVPGEPQLVVGASTSTSSPLQNVFRGEQLIGLIRTRSTKNTATESRTLRTNPHKVEAA